MNDKPIISKPENDIGYLIWQITKFWQRGKHKTLDEFGLTGSQMEVLGVIYHLRNEIEITQISLSQKTKIDPMTIFTILKNLEKKGLITRKGSKTDTRARVVELNDSGWELLNKASEKIKQLQEGLFRNIDKEALRAQLVILLEELNKSEIQ